MAYRMDYCPKKRRTGWAGGIAMALVLSFLLVGIFWPAGARKLRGILIPGDPAVTTAALEELAGDLRAGRPVRDSLEQLARHILGYAD